MSLKKLRVIYDTYNTGILTQEVEQNGKDLIKTFQDSLILNNQKFILHFIEHLITTKKYDELDPLFARVLPHSVSVPIWSLYTEHIFFNLQNDPERLIQSMEYVVSMIGQHINSLDIWEGFLEFMVEYSTTLSNREQHAKVTSKIRSLFNTALSVPISGYDIILNTYKKWEETNSSELADNLIPIIEQKSKLTKINYKKRLNHFTLCCSNKPYILPIDDSVETYILNWSNFINYEKSNPENLNKNVLFERINFTYKLCLNYMNHFSEFYVEYVNWLFSQKNKENTGLIDSMIQSILKTCLTNTFYNSNSIISVYNLMVNIGINFEEFENPLSFLKANILIETNPLLDEEGTEVLKGKVFSLLIENIFYENNSVDSVRDFYLKILETLKGNLSAKLKLLCAAIVFEFKIGNDKPTALKLLRYTYLEIDRERPLDKNRKSFELAIHKFNEFNENIKAQYLSIRELNEIEKLYSKNYSKTIDEEQNKTGKNKLQIIDRNNPIIFAVDDTYFDKCTEEYVEEGEIVDEKKDTVTATMWELGQLSLEKTEYPVEHYRHISKFLTLSKYLKTRKNNFQGISINMNSLAHLLSQMNPNNVEMDVIKRTSNENLEKEASELDKLLYNEKESFFINRILNKYK